MGRSQASLLGQQAFLSETTSRLDTLVARGARRIRALQNKSTLQGARRPVFTYHVFAARAARDAELYQTHSQSVVTRLKSGMAKS